MLCEVWRVITRFRHGSYDEYMMNIWCITHHLTRSQVFQWQVCGPGVDFRLVGERIEDVAVTGPRGFQGIPGDSRIIYRLFIGDFNGDSGRLFIGDFNILSWDFFRSFHSQRVKFSGLSSHSWRGYPVIRVKSNEPWNGDTLSWWGGFMVEHQMLGFSETIPQNPEDLDAVLGVCNVWLLPMWTVAIEMWSGNRDVNTHGWCLLSRFLSRISGGSRTAMAPRAIPPWFVIQKTFGFNTDGCLKMATPCYPEIQWILSVFPIVVPLSCPHLNKWPMVKHQLFFSRAEDQNGCNVSGDLRESPVLIGLKHHRKLGVSILMGPLGVAPSIAGWLSSWKIAKTMK